MGKILAYIGREVLDDGKLGDWVGIDINKPRVGVIVGKRGSGKTYSAGVLIEEMLDRNKRMSYIVIDIMGVYWSLKYPNKNPQELNKEGFAGLVEPKGYKDQVRVLVVEGDKDKYEPGTYDGTISITPSMVSFDVWLFVFNLEPEAPQSMLLKSVLEYFEKKGTNYSIDDMISLLDSGDPIVKSFQKQTVQGLRSKLLYAKSWGIFSEEGMTIKDLALPGVLTILDVSESSKPVAALLVGLIAERVYETRKGIARVKSWEKVSGKKAAKKVETIPKTWIIIEEAHNFLPSRATTKASAPLITYVKEGRHPGCGLLLVTQEPSALDVKVLKQIDFLLIHNLSHKDDIDAITEIAPSPLPQNVGDIVIRLKKGEALLSMIGETKPKRVSIRPKHSIHVARADITEEVIPEAEKAQTFSIWQELERLKRENEELREKIAEYEKLVKESTESESRFQKEISKLQQAIAKKEEIIKKLESIAEKQKVQQVIQPPQQQVAPQQKATMKKQVKTYLPPSETVKVSSVKKELLNSIVNALIDTIENRLSNTELLILRQLFQKQDVLVNDLLELFPGAKVIDAINKLQDLQLASVHGNVIRLNVDDLARSISIYPLDDNDLLYIKSKLAEYLLMS
ncbi:MAG: helicase HerA domain-containing protein [Candidatus Asgardarchaeia archaeon]